jgi:AcrR family transcriptional regulator
VADGLDSEPPPRAERAAVDNPLSYVHGQHGKNISSLGMRVRRSNAERTATTRMQLIKAARRLFAEQGYSSTTLAAVARTAGLTTGALYHHWAGKEDLLADVVHDLYRDLARRIRTVVAPDDDPVDQLLQAGHTFLSLCADRATARLLLLDAPAALGYERWRAIDDRWWRAPTTRLLEQTRDQRASTDQSGDPESLAVALLGALAYLGHDVAMSDTPSSVPHATRTYERIVTALLQ